MASVINELLDQMDLGSLQRMQDILSKAAALTPTQYSDKFEALHVQVEDQFTNLANQLATGRISVPLFRDRLFRILRKAMADAYRYGLGAAGERTILFQNDLDTIRGYLREDDTFLSQFARELISGEVPGTPFSKPKPQGRFNVHDRVILYSNALRALYYSGFTSRATGNVFYEWALGESEHCDNCLAMADGSPYNIAQLAGRMPGADVCLGLDRCQCSLVPTQASSFVV